MSPVRTHTFNNRKYNIDIRQMDGYCDQYKASTEDRFLAVLCDPNTQNGLITIVHEALHAVNWAKSEAVVKAVSYDIGRFLWRLGFRMKEKD